MAESGQGRRYAILTSVAECGACPFGHAVAGVRRGSKLCVERRPETSLAQLGDGGGPVERLPQGVTHRRHLPRHVRLRVSHSKHNHSKYSRHLPRLIVDVCGLETETFGPATAATTAAGAGLVGASPGGGGGGVVRDARHRLGEQHQAAGAVLGVEGGKREPHGCGTQAGRDHEEQGEHAARHGAVAQALGAHVVRCLVHDRLALRLAFCGTRPHPSRQGDDGDDGKRLIDR